MYIYVKNKKNIYIVFFMVPVKLYYLYLYQKELSKMSEEREEKPEEKEKETNRTESVQKEEKKDEVLEERKNIERMLNETYSEIDDCKQDLKYRDRVYPSLDILSLEFSDIRGINKEENKICHLMSGNKWETCVIKKTLSRGIFRIKFKRIGNTPVIFGIINAMYSCPVSGENLLDNKKGVGIAISDTFTSNMINKLKNDFYGVMLLSDGVGAVLGVTGLAAPLLGAAFGVGYWVKNLILNHFDHNTNIKTKENKNKSGLIRVEDEDEIILEINLRSEDPSKRTMQYFVNNYQSPVVFVGLPNEVQFAVSLHDDASYTEFLLLEEESYPMGYLTDDMTKVEWLERANT